MRVRACVFEASCKQNTQLKWRLTNENQIPYAYEPDESRNFKLNTAIIGITRIILTSTERHKRGDSFGNRIFTLMNE